MTTPAISEDMIAERARVLRTGNGVAWVQCESQAGCARCAAGTGCGGGLFARLLRGRLQELPVETRLHLNPGDWVMVGLATSAVQNASLLLYGLPLAGLLLGAIAGHQLAGTDLAALVGMLIGLFGGLALVRRFAAGLGARAGLQPVILRVIGKDEPCSGAAEARQ